MSIIPCYIKCQVFNLINEGPSSELSEVFVISIFGRFLSSVYTKSQDLLHSIISPFITDPRQIPRNNVLPLIVGLDIKMLDAAAVPPVACIQLCLRGHCIVYHMYNHTALPVALQRFLTDPNNTFVGVHLENSLNVLRHWANFEGHVAYRDLGQMAAEQLGFEVLATAGITLLVEAVMGRILRLRVGGQLIMIDDVDPQWDASVLLNEQVLCASVKAFLSYELGKILLDRF